MVSQFESAIVRVFGSDNRVVGTGFLITSNHIVTCCHVISQALNQADSILPPRESIFIDFPFLEREQFFSARVVHWLPKKGSSGDIAVLMLETPKPEKAEPAVIVTDAELTGRNVRTHGFPTGYEDDGRPALSVIVGLLAGGRLSIQGTSSYGVWVEGGFSGAPVWDDTLNAVVGMVVTVDTGVERSASIIPASMFSQYATVSQSRRDDTDILGAVVDYGLGSATRSAKTSDSFVFISYSHDDGEDIAKLLHNALERNGCRVWIDYKDLAANPGVDWDDEIDRAIEHCGTFVAVVTPLALTSMEVKGEWRLAQDERKPIVPAIRQPVRVPRNFRILQWIDLTNRANASSEIAKLIRKLGCSDGGSGDDVPLPTPPLTEPDLPDDLSSKKIIHIDEARAYAMALLRKRDYARLIQWSNELDAKLQEDADILALRAVAQDAIGNVRDALDDYTKAIQLDPQDANLYVQRASLNVDVGNIREAFEDFEKALKLNPDLQEIIDTETTAIVIFVREPDQLPMPLFDEIEGRAEIATLARNTLQTGERVLFYGIGGIGKTALSTVIAREYLAEKRTVLWVNVGSARLETLLNAIGQELERALDRDKAFKQAESVEQKTSYISDLLKRENPLLILDDAWNPEETKQFLMSVVPPGCPTIVTTRRTDFDDIPGLIKLNLAELSIEASVNLYQAINENDKNRHDVEKLCRILGFHPLAIRLAALMGKNRGMNAALTLTRLENLQAKNPIRAIFDAVIESAAEDNRRVFAAIGALPVTRVTDEFVALILDESVEAVAAKSRYLADQGLINPTISPEGEAFYAVHDLTYAYAHDLLLEQGKHAALEHKVVEAACGYVAKHADSFPKLAVERPTLIASITRAKGYQDHESIYTLVDGLLTFLDYQGYSIDHLNVLNLALDVAEAQRDKGKQGRYWNELATIFVKLGRYKQAIQYFELALGVSREFGDRRSEGSIIGNLANVYALLGELRQAIGYYENALQIIREIGDRIGEASLLNNLGSAWDTLGEKQQALDYFNQALSIRRAVGDRRGEATTLSNIGAVWNALGEKQKALDFYEQALPISRAIGDRRSEANTLSNIGAAWDALGEKQRALDYYEQALSLSRAIGDRRGESNTLSNIGNVFSNLGEKQRALDYYQQALSLSRAVGDRGGEAITLNNMGSVYVDLDNIQRAFELYQQALPLSRAVGDRGGEAATLNNIGRLYRNSGELEKALENYKRALLTLQEAGDKSALATVMGNIGAIYSDLRDYEQAKLYNVEALKISQEIGDREIEATALNNIGDVYFKTNDFQNAIETFEKTVNIFTETGQFAEQAAALFNLSLAYTRLNKSVQALDSLTTAKKILDDKGLQRDSAGNTVKEYEYSISQLTSENDENNSSFLPSDSTNNQNRWHLEQLSEVFRRTFTVIALLAAFVLLYFVTVAYLFPLRHHLINLPVNLLLSIPFIAIVLLVIRLYRIRRMRVRDKSIMLYPLPRTSFTSPESYVGKRTQIFTPDIKRDSRSRGLDYTMIEIDDDYPTPVGWIVEQETDKRWRITNKVTKIGRVGGNNDISLEDHAVSRLHCHLEYDPETNTITLFDDGSASGTFVNGEWIKPGESVILKNNDSIRLSKNKHLVFQINSEI